MTLRKDLLEMLACPKCGGPVALTGSGEALVCPDCRLLYEIRNGIPVMLVEESKSLDRSETGKTG